MSETVDPAHAASAQDCGCPEALDRLWEYLDAELTVPDKDVVSAHLAHCTGCLEEHEVERVMKAVVRRGCQEVAPEELRVRIHERITVLRVRGALPDQL